ncbi:MAG: hypothetical protein AUJ52_03565 [Elusimicrobia bacterium CG1_02_63_36]|nr:MAG: hypothetical protein AUJ52_03565 [Elusimicrobia bacterium CG1_02_63_36]PIP83408.1 MAG: hypothetical protein COR54_09770 [Elusimicrobia bacterium CG22_combo_CG10-13_8_21_14_all_63_91]PJA13471.1 MAG: hypothetical protein COX66_14720 [Elusimicrobia bacterium CG_4_10_14_0_2_um_filter_63_34]PJB25357.1 MAG: hypothetical protein CO113_08905 [Elusimicrobia bacterium CG_4_9_14_3_um_filter_62_55]
MLAAALLSGSASAERPDSFDFESAEASVPPSHWIDKACGGEGVRFSVYGSKTDQALKEFGSAMDLPSPRPALSPTHDRDGNGAIERLRIAKAQETFGMSPSEPSARASWDYSNSDPKQGAACRLKLNHFVRKYGNRLQFSNAPTGFFAARKPFSRTVTQRVKKLSKNRIASNTVRRDGFYDGSANAPEQSTQAASGGIFGWLFGGGSRSSSDAIREASASPRAQPSSLRSRSVPGPSIEPVRKSYGEEIMDWTRDKIAAGSSAINFHLNRIKDWVVAKSVTGGNYVSEKIANQLVAWAKALGRKIVVNSASRKGGADYSDVHKTHRGGETDIHIASARDAAVMIATGIQTGARIDYIGYTYKTALLAAAKQIYGPTSAVYRKMASPNFIKPLKKHTTHLHVDWG